LPHSSVYLTKATTEDLPLISELANIIWHQHYVEIIGAEQVKYMLDKMYTVASLKDQMEKQHHVFYLIKNEDKTIGFISVSGSEKTKSYFINKFYILQDTAAKGIGSDVFNKIIKLLDAEELKLTCNRKNYKSINFYFKNGFKIERVADFDIGNGFVMNDFVFVWKKTKA
jgi:GNAT superfamily N-acetyltransferase